MSKPLDTVKCRLRFHNRTTELSGSLFCNFSPIKCSFRPCHHDTSTMYSTVGPGQSTKANCARYVRTGFLKLPTSALAVAARQYQNRLSTFRSLGSITITIVIVIVHRSFRRERGEVELGYSEGKIEQGTHIVRISSWFAVHLAYA